MRQLSKTSLGVEDNENDETDDQLDVNDKLINAADLRQSQLTGNITVSNRFEQRIVLLFFPRSLFGRPLLPTTLLAATFVY